MPEWYSPQRGYYIAKYRGKTLEVTRNTDATDKRRYVAQVDGVILPHPCHTIPQCKTKAQKWAETPALPVRTESDPVYERPPPDEHVNGVVVPYLDPGPPVAPDNLVMIELTIVGQIEIPADKLALAVNNVQAAIDMLRGDGFTLNCVIKPPGMVRL